MKNSDKAPAAGSGDGNFKVGDHVVRPVTTENFLPTMITKFPPYPSMQEAEHELGVMSKLSSADKNVLAASMLTIHNSLAGGANKLEKESNELWMQTCAAAGIGEADAKSGFDERNIPPRLIAEIVKRRDEWKKTGREADRLILSIQLAFADMCGGYRVAQVCDMANERKILRRAMRLLSCISRPALEECGGIKAVARLAHKGRAESGKGE